MTTEVITVGQLVDRYRNAMSAVATGVKAKLVERLGPVTCRPHCSYCCYSKILAPTFVGVFIYLYLRRQGMWTKELRDKLVEADRVMTVRTHADWLATRRPCPFLDEKSFGHGDCTIYPVRPEACAITHSVAGDGSKCADVGGNNLVAIVDLDALLPFLPLVLAVQRFCKPVVTTLPASVLLAEAAFERLPEPAVASVPASSTSLTQSSAKTLEESFDGKYATFFGGG